MQHILEVERIGRVIATVLLWIKNGQRLAQKIGRSWYVRIEEIRKLVSAERVAE